MQLNNRNSESRKWENRMTFKCKLGEEKTCSILNEKLGDCEICEDDFCSEYGYKVVWRCPNYEKCVAEINTKKEAEETKRVIVKAEGFKDTNGNFHITKIKGAEE